MRTSRGGFETRPCASRPWTAGADRFAAPRLGTVSACLAVQRQAAIVEAPFLHQALDARVF